MTGAGLVVTGPVAVTPTGRITPECPGLYTDEHTGAWRAVVADVKAHAHARVGVLLSHAGRRGATRPRRGGVDRPLGETAWSVVAPSPIAYAAAGPSPREMSPGDVAAVRGDFVRAAERARDAGADVLMLNAAHGYLLASFLSPLANRRTDEYGGTLQARMRFLLEVTDGVRAVWPTDRALGVVLVADDCAPDGLRPADAVVVARALKDRGVDVVQPAAGHSVPGAHAVYGRGFLTALCDRIRVDRRIRTLASGYLVTADDVNTILAAGRADLCVMDPPEILSAATPPARDHPAPAPTSAAMERS